MLRADFAAAITSDRADATLDSSIAALRRKIMDDAFTAPLSIYSKSQLRRMNDSLRGINTACLDNNPLNVAVAVSMVLQQLDNLKITMLHTESGKARIQAAVLARSGGAMQ